MNIHMISKSNKEKYMIYAEKKNAEDNIVINGDKPLEKHKKMIFKL